MLSALVLARLAACGGQETAGLAYGAYMLVQNMSKPACSRT